MAIKFSDETKRSIWIIVAVGVALALVSGTWAMLQEIFKGDTDSGSVSSTESGLVMPSGPVPAEVETWFAEDLGNLGQPYPEGVSVAAVPDLLPHVKGSTLKSSDNDSITIEMPKNYVDAEAKEGETTFGVYRRGDIAVIEALQWRCDWANAYATAVEGEDPAAAKEAQRYLELFPEIEVVKGLPVARENESELETLLVDDPAQARQWVTEKCG